MAITVLFVDDDPDILSGFKRMLHVYRKEWDQLFAISGQEALSILSTNNVDVIISDMKMPEMDGAELLTIVKEKYPQIIRIILSGHLDEMKAVKSTISAHQFLVKPCDANIIKNKIEKAFLMRDYLHHDDMMKVINGIGKLPSLPELYMKIEEELQKSEVSFERLQKIIYADPALTAKILQTVNSGFFGLSVDVTNLLQALSFLGVNTIKSLVLYFKTFSFQDMPVEARKHCEIIGNHSLQVATLAKNLMKNQTNDRQEHDNAFIIGVLHDVGKLVLLNTSNYVELMSSLEKKISETNRNQELYKLEYEKFGYSHSEAGAYLLGIWGLPENIVESVALHHLPHKIFSDSFSSLTAVHLANSFINSKNINIVFNDNDSDEDIEKKNLLLSQELSDLDIQHLTDIGKLSELYILWNEYIQLAQE